MTGVGQQGKRVDVKPDEYLDDHKEEIENDTDHKGPVYFLEVDLMMVVVTKTMGMPVVMSVIVTVAMIVIVIMIVAMLMFMLVVIAVVMIVRVVLILFLLCMGMRHKVSLAIFVAGG